MWLKNCRSTSPEKERFEPKSPSRSPCSPLFSPFMSVDLNEKMRKSLGMSENPSVSSLATAAKITSGAHSNEVKKPLINVLPSSKLLSRNLLHHKSLRKRRVTARLSQSAKINQLRSNRLVDSNFAPDLQGKIHTQTSSNNSNRPNQSAPPSQFAQRPPLNLFKLRMPFPPSILASPLQQRMQHQPPGDEPNMNLLPPPNSLLPPSVVLVPYPIMLPIVLPIPLPLTAFLKAYQTKPAAAKGNGEKSSNENHNDSHEKDINAEQPLDLSSEQGVFCDTDKNFISRNNTNGDVISEDSSEIKTPSNNNTHRIIPEYVASSIGANKRQYHPVVKDDMSNEYNRPLRKRKIITNSTEELSQ